MKKTIRKMKKMPLGLFLISCMIFSCQSTQEKPWDRYLQTQSEENTFQDTIPYSRETKIWKAYTDSLKIDIPSQEYTYIIIPSASCGGCVSTAIYALFPESGPNTMLIVGEDIAEKYPQLYNQERVFVDTASLCDKLNWEYGNIIEIKTKNKQVIHAKSYTSDEMYNM